MALICAITQVVPEEPVISIKSGCIFEKKVILSYIKEHHKDPVSNVDLTEDMLVAVRNPPIFVKPRPGGTLSIPDLLNLLRDEWDSCMLSHYKQQQQLMTTRQELTHALYQFDASARALARLKEECDELREKIASRPNINVSNNHSANDMAVDLPPQKRIRFDKQEPMEQDIGINTRTNIEHNDDELYNRTLVPESEERAKVLMAERRERMKNNPPGFVLPPQIRDCNNYKDMPLPHSSSTKGILCIDVCSTDSNKLTTGGRDSNVLIFNVDKEQVTHTLKGHKKQINKVVFHPNSSRVISGSSDRTVRVWSTTGDSYTSICIEQQDEVNDISLHATGDYLLASSDYTWTVSDLRSGKILKSCSSLEDKEHYTKVQFHPDGQLFATGTTHQLDIWDVQMPKSRKHSIKICCDEDIKAMTFCENGYYLASASDTNHTVTIWDLRKIGAKVKFYELSKSYTINDLSFDMAGTYLAVAGSDVRIYLCKKQPSPIARWETVKIFEKDEDQQISSVRFGSSCQYVACTYQNRNILKLHVP